MTSTSSGRQAEIRVAEYLQSKKHKILATNWRTRWCEIDIVSKYKKRIYFTEVKYRRNSAWGSGLDYIDRKKLQQIRFAAEFWIHEHAHTGEVELLAAEVTDDTITVIQL